MGITTAGFLIVLTLGYFLLFKPLPYAEQDKLYLIDYQRWDQHKVLQSAAILHPAAEHLYQQLQQSAQDTASQQALLYFTNEVLASEPAQPRLANAYVTPELAELLSIKMAVGNWFGHDYRPGSFNTGAVISYQAWQQLFQQRHDILTLRLNVNGVSHPIIGVLDKAFVAPQLTEIGQEPQLWLPWDYNNSPFQGSWWLTDDKIFLLLKLEQSRLQKLSTELTPIVNEYYQQHIIAHDNFRNWQVVLEGRPLRDALIADNEKTLLLLVLGAAGLLLLALLLSGLAVRSINYRQLSHALQGSGKGTDVQVSPAIRKSLVVAQVSIATLLIFFSALLVQDSIAKLNRSLGFDSQHILQIEFDIATLDWQGWDHYAPQVAGLGEQLRLRPDVEQLSFAYSPLADLYQLAITDMANDRRYYPWHRNVDHHYFSVVGQRLLFGNTFTRDDLGSDKVVIIDQAFAELLTGADIAKAIGQSLKMDAATAPMTVIGVVENLQLPGKHIAPPRFYLPNYGTALWMLVKLKPDTELNRESMIELLHSLNPQFILTRFNLLDTSIAQANFPHRVRLIAAISLALFTIFLACIGLFGIMHYSVQIRSIEFSIKLAVGAQYHHIVKDSIREYLTMLILGIGLATLIALTSLVIFYDWLIPYLSWHSLLLYAVTLLIILVTLTLSNLMPLRSFRTISISNKLRGLYETS
ncbi:ABC transporter permease [Alishewanella longhuensis]|nr:ABC transporter permease [Alishewanella longhuensis]